LRCDRAPSNSGVVSGTPPRAWVPGHRRSPSRVYDVGEEEFLGTSRFLGSRDHFPGAAGVPCGNGGIAGCSTGPGIVWAGTPPFMMLEAGRDPEKYARKRDVSMKMTAAAAVILLRKLVGPLEPNRVWEEPPPKTAPISAPFPVWRRMMRMRVTDTTMCRITIRVYIALYGSSVIGTSRFSRTTRRKGLPRRRAPRRCPPGPSRWRCSPA
jgi:hypothetical protein